MLKIKDSNRENPTFFKCGCGEKVTMALHWDFLEGQCKCGKQYTIAVVSTNIWNCCCPTDNDPLYNGKPKE